jgi:chromosome partitioning protein
VFCRSSGNLLDNWRAGFTVCRRAGFPTLNKSLAETGTPRYRFAGQSHRRNIVSAEDRMIISFLNQKGGVGKTTLAIHTADTLARAGHRVMVIDADPQGSALDWSTARQGEPLFPVVGMPKPSIHKDLPSLAAGYDAIVIDCPPRVYDVARSAIMASDLIVIPVQPSPYDVWAAQEINDLIAEGRVYRPDLKAVFVINRKIANTAIGRDVAEALANYPMPVMKSSLTQRVTFAESATAGRTVAELDPESLASREIATFVDELLELAA